MSITDKARKTLDAYDRFPEVCIPPSRGVLLAALAVVDAAEELENVEDGRVYPRWEAWEKLERALAKFKEVE